MTASQALPELATVPWRARTDARWLRRWQRVWHAWTLLYTVPFLAAAAGMLWLDPITAPVAFVAAAHAWIIPELYAARGATVARPKGPRHEHAEAVAQGLLGDLLGHDERELQRRTGLALEHGDLGVWLVGEAGALLLTPGGHCVHSFCVHAAEPDVRPLELLAQRHDHVTRLQGAGGGSRQQRRIEKEVDVGDQQDAGAVARQAALETARRVQPAESPAGDHHVVRHRRRG